ncbi:MAG: hypothetical protein OQK12_08205 [Motiliproteus sp.]|nr:hypothetical protein [Motiliproteus sp.]MCW9050802.1 hypothetical protein [Motiliproteus sp.]
MNFKHSLCYLPYLCLALLLATPSWASERFKVVVVMSYEENNPWCQEIKQGIDSVLADTSDIEYIYMDTKVNFAGGQAKADQAFERIKQTQPDGIITADDNVQKMLVVPYLKNQTQTPVMFCGVNANPSAYGYPADNVSGILERGHIRESIAFLKQLKESIAKVCFLAKDSPSGLALKRQVKAEESSYLAKNNGFYLTQSTDQIKQQADTLNAKCDAIYIDSLEGIMDSAGNPLNHLQVFAALEAAYKGPIIGANKYHVDQGALSAVVKTGQEQGEEAAKLLLKAMQGAPVSELPITRNFRGRRIINITTMERQNINPRPIVLRSASLVSMQK